MKSHLTSLTSSTWILIIAAATGVHYGCSGAEMASSGGAPAKNKPLSQANATSTNGSNGPLQCIDKATIASAKQMIDIGVSGLSAKSVITVPDGKGTAINNGSLITYTAPASIPAETEVQIDIKDGSASTSCNVKLISNGSLLIPDDGNSRALLANVYALPVNTRKLPNLDMMTPIRGKYMAPNVEVSSRNWALGFPGDSSLVEWFAIRFEGKISVPVNGRYSFKFYADDGAILYINDRVVLDNDGLSAPGKTPEASIDLPEGSHKIRVDYFQGPRDALGVILYWKMPGESSFYALPAANIIRP